MVRKTVLTRRWFAGFALLAAAIGLCLSAGPGNAQEPAVWSRADAAPSQVSDAERAEIARRLANTFDLAVKQHAAATQVLAWLKPGQCELVSSYNRAIPVPEHPPYYSGLAGLYRSEAMENLAGKLAATGRRDEAAAYLRIAEGYLNHRQPQYRAVACEFLAHFPLQVLDSGLLPPLGERLGDSATAFDGAQSVMGQQTTGIRRIVPGVSVADLAEAALHAATGHGFQKDAKAFEDWRQGNKDYHHRLWYWALRWSYLPWAPPPPEVLASKTPVAYPASRVSVETEFPALVGELGPEEALKTLLLAYNVGAIAAQSKASFFRSDEPIFRNPNVRLAANAPVLGFYGTYVEPKVAAKFVEQYSLKPRLLEILRQDQPWPEVAAKESKRNLLAYVIEVLKIVATRADADAIQEALDHPIPALALGSEGRTPLTLLLTRLDPQRAEAILLAPFIERPNLGGLAAELIRTTGLKHWDTIAPAAQDRRVRALVLPALGRLQTSQAAKVLSELFASEDLTLKIDEWGLIHANDLELFEGYVSAAALLNGNRPVLDEDLLNRARGMPMKVPRYEQQKQAALSLAARAEAIDRLKKFFARAAAPAMPMGLR